MQRHGSLFQKLQSFDQIDDFSCFFTKWGTSCNFFLKSSSKCKDMVLCSKSSKVLAKSMVFRTNYHVLVFRWTFQQKVAKSDWIREKAQKIIDFGSPKLCNFSSKLPCLCISRNFSGKSCERCLISWKSTKSHGFRENLQLYEQTTMFWHFHELFSKNLQQVPHLVKKHEKSSIWQKLSNFSNKLPFLCISINFSGKRCRKCLISWKSTKNHRFGQNFATFRTNYHVFAFRWTFQEKVTKSASFREKAPEIVDIAKTLQLLEQTTMSLHLDELLRKKSKKWFISRKSTKTDAFSKNLTLFEKTTMFWRFDKLFAEKLQKLSHFVKKHEKPSIWPKLCIFF